LSTDSTYDFATPAPNAQPAPAAPPTATSAEHVTERNCPQCGFRIVGKPRQNRCPDCRMPLDASLADRLQNSGSRWIRKASWGALAIGISILPHIFGAWQVAVQRQERSGAALHVVGAALTLAGIWILTLPEDPRRPRASPLAVAARWCALASVILWGGAMITAFQHGNERWLIAPALLAMAGEAVAYGLFAAGIALRIPHEGLANQLRNFALLLPPFFGFMLFCVFNDLAVYMQIFFCSFPLLGGIAGLMLWIAATQVRLFLELRHTARAADALAQRHFQAAEAAARAAAKGTSAGKQP
jgi:hypothetical protein